MSWNDIDANELATVSFPVKAKGLMIKREPGPSRIIVEAVPVDNSKTLFLRIPANLHARVERCVAGSRNAAMIAVIEEALDRLESNHQCWRVVSLNRQD